MRKLLLLICCLAYSMAAPNNSSNQHGAGLTDERLLLIDNGKNAVVGVVPLRLIPERTVTSDDDMILYEDSLFCEHSNPGSRQIERRD